MAGLWSLDYKLGLRMLRKYPGLTLAGGLALSIAIGIGVGWYDISGKLFAPTIPLPQGDRLVLIETQNTLTNQPGPRSARDFIEWRRELRAVEELGAYRTDTRNLVVGNGPRRRELNRADTRQCIAEKWPATTHPSGSLLARRRGNRKLPHCPWFR